MSIIVDQEPETTISGMGPPALAACASGGLEDLGHVGESS